MSKSFYVLYTFKPLYIFGIVVTTLFFLLTGINDLHATYLGIGGQYSYSFLNYKIQQDSFTTYDDIQHLEQVGIKNGANPKSYDYGFCIIIDDGDDFEYLNHINLRLEYYRFKKPFDDVNNTITGFRSGWLVTFGFDLIGSDTYKLFLGADTGLYFSSGSSSNDSSSYQTFEIPIGITLGNKIAVSDNTACVLSLTYNYYNWFINEPTYFGGFNNVSDTTGFMTRRNEVILSINYVIQVGSIFF